MSQDSTELFVATDIETDGPVPGLYSMLSIGCAAYTAEKRLVSTFSRNMDALPGARQFPAAMKFWADNPEIWTKCRENAIPPAQAMEEFQAWLAGLHGRPVFVAHPVGFDFSFVNWYLYKFLGSSPWIGALDICSYAMGMLRLP